MTWMGMGPPFPRRQGTRYAQSADQTWFAKSLDNHLADCRRGGLWFGMWLKIQKTSWCQTGLPSKFAPTMDFKPLRITFFNPQICCVSSIRIWKRNETLLHLQRCSGWAAMQHFSGVYTMQASRSIKHLTLCVEGAEWLEGPVRNLKIDVNFQALRLVNFIISWLRWIEMLFKIQGSYYSTNGSKAVYVANLIFGSLSMFNISRQSDR